MVGVQMLKPSAQLGRRRNVSDMHADRETDIGKPLAAPGPEGADYRGTARPGQTPAPGRGSVPAASRVRTEGT